MPRVRPLVWGAIVVVVIVLGLQIWATVAMIQASRSASEQLSQQLRGSDASKLSHAKTQEEILSLRTENERKTVFATALVANVNAAIAVLVALAGAAIGFHQYLGLRRKDRSDRAAVELTELWKGIASSQMNVRAASIAGLQHFLDSEKAEYHPRVAAALALVGRLDNNDEVVSTTLSRVVETAMGSISADVLRAISWQGLRLHNANLSDHDLAGFDFRDARLHGCDFSNSKLARARLDAAELNWSRLSDVDLTEASLRYADLAGASLLRAKLVRANLRHVKILGTDLSEADLTDASLTNNAIDWALTRNWRDAKLDAALRQRLLLQYGPEVSGRRVLMLLWEYPPFVSGGGWTAVYHLLKNLRTQGVNVTLMIPWAESDVSFTELGYEHQLLCCGITLAQDASGYAAYSTYSKSGAYGSARNHAGRTQPLAALVAEFEYRAVELVNERELQFDLIHAHDWLTFETGAQIASRLAIPWVAHFHSLEKDRRSEHSSRSILRMERVACERSNGILAVSRKTASDIVAAYKVPSARIGVAPNCLHAARNSIVRLGSFDSGRVVFLGRLSAQKGPDHFVRMAAKLKSLRPNTKFAMYGDGEAAPQLSALILKLGPKQSLTWGTDSWRYWNFSAIEQVDIEPETGAWVERGPLPNSQKSVIADLLNERETLCEIVALPLATPYTHLITVLKGRMAVGNSYLVSIPNVVQYSELPDPFVVLEGELSWEERGYAFEGASALVVPSRDEPFGMVVLEAMRAGVPVLYPGTAGVAEVVQTGLKIDPNDHEQAATMLAELLSQFEKWEQVVEEQIAEVLTYSERRYEQKIVDYWDSVLRADARVSGSPDRS